MIILGKCFRDTMLTDYSYGQNANILLSQSLGPPHLLTRVTDYLWWFKDLRIFCCLLTFQLMRVKELNKTFYKTVPLESLLVLVFYNCCPCHWIAPSGETESMRGLLYLSQDTMNIHVQVIINVKDEANLYNYLSFSKHDSSVSSISICEQQHLNKKLTFNSKFKEDDRKGW